MSLTIHETSLPGVLLIEPKVFQDDRGFFMETFHAAKYAEASIVGPFVQDNHSHSRRGVLRGLHYQLKHPQAKLISVTQGEVYDVAVDIRRNSPHFGKWFAANLSAANKRQLFIPAGFAHGFYVLSETADVTYKCSDLYAPGDDYGILWSDPALDIKWPLTKPPLLSDKDKQYRALSETAPELLPEV